MDFLASVSPVLLWFIVGAIFFLVEMALPGFIIFFFGIGAWCAALVCFLTPIELSIQLLIFLATSLLSLFLLRSMLKRTFYGEIKEKYSLENEIPDGATGVVVEDILPPANGQVKYSGSFWTASAAEPILAGAQVSILKQENLTLTVAPLFKEEKKA